MPNSEQINSIIDIPVVTKQFEVVISGLKDIDAAIKAVKPLADIYKGSDGAAKLRESNDQLVKGNQTLQKSQSELSVSLKEYQKLLDQNAQATARMNASQSSAGKELAATRIAQVELNKELKNTTIVSQAAQGSIEQMRAQLALLTSQYDKMSAAQRSSPQGSALQQQIKGQVEALKQLEAETGRYQRNVGNYTGAIQILEKSLQDVKQKLQDFTNAGNGNSQQAQKFREEEALLEQVLNKNTQGFSSLTMEIRANERALATMFEQGMSDTEAFKQLQLSTANAKRELTEFQKQQKLLSSQTPALSSMMVAVKGLGGLYATGAGAAALFADGNEKVEKELNKLVAIMTVLQGLNEVHELVEQKGAIATTLRAAAEKLKNFVMTGSTQGIVQNTVAQEANTVATEAGSVATKGLSVAMVGLRAALIATGIGALLILLPSIAAAMDKSSDSSEKFNERMDELKETSPKVAESLRDLGKTAEEVADNLIKKLENETENLREALGQIPTTTEQVGASLDQLKEREKDLMKEFSQRKVSEEQNIWMRWFGRTSNDVIKDLKKISDTEESLRQKATLDSVADTEKKAMKNQEVGFKELEFQEKIEVAKAKLAGKTEKEIFDIEQRYADLRITLLGNLSSALVQGDENRIKLEEQLTEEKNKKQLAALDFLNNQKKKAAKTDNSEVDIEKKINEQVQRELDARFEIYKLHAQQKIALDKQIAENDQANEGIRLLALHASLKEEQDVIQQETERKVEKIQQETQLQLKSEQLTQKERAAIAKAAQAEIDLAVEQGYEQQVKASEEAQKILDNIQKSIQKDPTAGIRDKLSSGKIRSAVLDEINNATELFNEKQGDKKDDGDAQKKKYDAYAAYAHKAVEVATALFNRAHELRMNQIQEEIDKTTEQRDAEIDRINQSTLSEQDKAAKIAQIQASAQAKEDQLNQKKKEEQIKEAKFNKAKALIDVAINTAVAVTKDLIDNKAMIPIDIAMGAAEGAIILAQPIPKYAEGIGNHPGGPAWVGDGGKHELISYDGKSFLSPNRDTLINLPKGATVKPMTSDEVNQILYASMMRSTANALNYQSSDFTPLKKEIASLKQTVEWQTKELKKAYGQKQKTVVNVHNHSDWHSYIKRKVYD